MGTKHKGHEMTRDASGQTEWCEECLQKVLAEMREYIAAQHRKHDRRVKANERRRTARRNKR